MTYNFIPISKEEFAQKVVKNNKGEKKQNIIEAIVASLKDVRKGQKCSCGNPIWVAGSVFVGNSCFTCITGEVDASEDYEIDEVIKARSKSKH